MMNRRQTGLSLVELMVGLTLGLLLVGIAVSIYLSGRQTSRVVDTVGRLEESARFAVEAIEQDIRMTGFRGCNGMANSPVNTLNSPGSFNNRFDQTLFGYHGSGSTWTPALDTSISSLPQPPIAGTDVIAIKRTYDNGAALTAQMTGTTGAVTVEASAPFAQGDYILVSDCEAQAVFQATQVTSSPTTGSLSHAAVAVPTPGNASADLTHVFNTDASAYRVVT
ncbi:MAG: prepilin-type N-terminal cleavage/methylation domain-containing protein, partial [Pseudomonadota bacterium]